MAKQQVTDIRQSEHDYKMEVWAKKHPFAAMMMFGKQFMQEKIEIAEEMFISYK